MLIHVPLTGLMDVILISLLCTPSTCNPSLKPDGYCGVIASSTANIGATAVVPPCFGTHLIVPRGVLDVSFICAEVTMPTDVLCPSFI